MYPVMSKYNEFTQIEWSEVKAAPLGQTFDVRALKECCKAVRSAVTWQGKNPGFAVVVAMNSFRRFGRTRREIVLLDEVESRDMAELIHKCEALHLKYKPADWYGDPDNAAANRIIQRLNQERQNPFSLIRPTIIGMDKPYQFILQSLRPILKPENRELFLKDSQIIDYLGQINEDEETDLELGSFPAIEALSFAALEDNWEPSITNEEIRRLNIKYGKVNPDAYWPWGGRRALAR